MLSVRRVYTNTILNLYGIHASSRLHQCFKHAPSTNWQWKLLIKADETNKRGQKNIIDGETELLNGFEFNAAAPLYQTFGVKYEASIDRASGVAQVKIPSYNMVELVKAPFESSHFRLHIEGAEVDFEQGAYVAEFRNSVPVSVKSIEGSALDLSFALVLKSKK